MNTELRLSLTEEELSGVSELIALCNREDGTGYDTEPEGDFFYIVENPGEEESGASEQLLSVLFGYRIGEREDGKEVLELMAFTHPSVRRQGMLRAVLNALMDDFRGFRYHFIIKPPKDNVSEGEPAESCKAVITALSMEHVGDELFLEKRLKRGISNPGDSLCDRYGELYLSRYKRDTLYLYGLRVYDSYLRQGHGRRLMEAVEGYREGPYKKILLQVGSRNKAAYSLYMSLDYHIIDRSCRYSLPCK